MFGTVVIVSYNARVKIVVIRYQDDKVVSVESLR